MSERAKYTLVLVYSGFVRTPDIGEETTVTEYMVETCDKLVSEGYLIYKGVTDVRETGTFFGAQHIYAITRKGRDILKKGRYIHE